ncbi:uncharacterized protein LOC100880155 [Megachile rotundata]|uniref:uncharacterized protein LOC100880155 n=1 Tax=Megachile rotundata TaxID=143995 RepID=UPI000258EC2D|nr:PREDICTED: trans-Golgi network integral membrane protein 1-like [Megachile rotundata]
MGERTVRLLCKLSIFSFFIFFIKMSNAASVPGTKNIIDTIKNDKNLQCKLPESVYDSSIIKDCHNLTYPENTTKIKDLDPDILKKTILCIAFHDMLYKVCSSNMTSQIPNDNAKFQSYIEKFYPENDESHRIKFCENIKSVKVSNKQLLPLLSLIHLNESTVCHATCFNIQGNFNPPCAIFALSKKIDEDIRNINKSHQTQSQTSTVTNGVQQSKSLSESLNPVQTSSHANANDNTAVEPQTTDIKTGVVSESKIPQKENSDKMPVDLDKTPENSKKISNNQATSSKNQDKTTENQSKTLEKQDKIPEDLDKAPENKDNAPEFEDVPENQGNAPENESNMPENEGNAGENLGNAPENNINDDEKNKKDANDIKTSTISENTQNQENSVNQDEWNRLVDDKSSYDTNDVSDHAVDTAIMPEPEQRNIISRYHSIRSGERSHFFTYFTVFSLISIAAYVGYHNKQKILAMVLEGRRSRSNRGRRRPSTANYRKLDCTLEEAVTSQCNANVTHVIY